MIMANHKLIIVEPYKDMIINSSQNNISQSKQIINYKCQFPLIKTNINYNTRYYIFEKYIIQPIKYQFLVLKTPSFQMQHISIINQQPEQQYFCFLMIRTTPASIFGYVYFAINITFFLLICCEMMKLKRQGLFSRISLSLRILCIWSGLSLVQISYYQYTYYYLNKHPELSNEQKSTISSIEFIITFLQIFLIHTSLLLAPYYWHSNILDYLQNQSTIFDNQEQKIGFVANLKSNFDWIIKRFVHCYLIIRAVLLSAMIIVLCIFANSQNQQLKNSLAKITYVFALVDSFFMLIIYILGLIAIKNNIKLNSAMQDEQFKKILKKYMLVIVTTLIRLIIFFIRNPFFGPLQSKFMTTNCQNKMKDEDKWKNLGFIIFQALVMDLLPAIIIYILYRVPKQNKQSLINQQRNSNQYIE